HDDRSHDHVQRLCSYLRRSTADGALRSDSFLEHRPSHWHIAPDHWDDPARRRLCAVGVSGNRGDRDLLRRLVVRRLVGGRRTNRITEGAHELSPSPLQAVPNRLISARLSSCHRILAAAAVFSAPSTGCTSSSNLSCSSSSVSAMSGSPLRVGCKNS